MRLLATRLRRLSFLLKFLFFGFCLSIFTLHVHAQISAAGDILFVGYNADGADGFSFVTLVNLMEDDTIYFSDMEWDGDPISSGGFSSGEGALTWFNDSGAPIPEGSVIIINSSSNTPMASIGTAIESDAGFDPGGSDEVIYAFLGSDDNTPTLFISAIANDDFNDGTLLNTGLTEGVDAIRIDIIDANADVAVYCGPIVCNLTIDDCRMMIVDVDAYWNSDDGTGDQSQDGMDAEFPIPNGSGCGIPNTFSGSAFTGCTISISGRDTSFCGIGLVDLRSLLSGLPQGGLRFGTTHGIYEDTVSTLVSVSTTTTYYLQDSVSPICMDTTSITISINPIPKLSGRDTTICLRDSLDVRALLDIDPMGTLRYGLSFSVYGTSDSVVVSPEVSTTYFLIDSIESTGCFDTTMLQVLVVGPDLDLLSTQTNTCPDKVVDLSMITLIDQNTVIGIAEVSYYNSESDAVDSINALTSSEVDVSGIYFIRYDIGGCYDTASVSVVIEDCPVPCDISVTLLDTICNVNGSYDLVYAMDTTNASGLQYIASISGYNIDTLSYKSNGGLDTLYGLTTGALSDTLIIEDYNPYAGIFISELHYDNTGSDVDEGVEIMAPEGTDLEGFGLLFYNGSNGASYGSVLPMTGVIGSQGGGCGAIFFDRSGIQNGPDGIALLGPTGDVVAFMSYEGSFIATNGPAKGMTSMDIGVSESGSTPIGGSLQMNDAGWQSAETATYDVINLGLSCSVMEICSDTLVYSAPNCPTCITSISGRDTSFCGIGLVDLRSLLSGLPQGGLRYGTSYGAYEDTVSTLVSVSTTTTYYLQDSVSPICMDTTSITISINPIPKLSGRDTTICLRDSLDVRALLDIDPMGTLRYGLSFSVYGTSDSVVVSPEVSTTYFLIDSIESTGCFDTTMLQVLVVGPDLDLLSTQTNTCPDKVVDLSMITLIDQNTVIGMAEVSYYNSESDAVDSINALTSSEVDVSGIYFIRYDIGGCYDTASVSVVIEDCPVPCDISVTLLDTICNVNGSYDLVYAMDTTNASGLQYIASISGYNIDTLSYKSNGGLDTLYGLTTGALSDTLIIEDYNPYAGIFISELHYDNTGSDVDEGVEIMAPEGTDLEGFGLLFYNGSNGASYGSVLPMTGVIGSQGGGCGAIFFDRRGIQNGPDGIALLGPRGDVVAFMSYEGSFIATNGPAKGMTSMDIGVSESGSTPIGRSLQMNDAGWQSAETATYDVINLGLSCSVIEICSDTLVYSAPNCPACITSISGRDTSFCGIGLVDLRSLLSGLPQGGLRYGTSYGAYEDTVSTLVSVSTTTTYYLQDSVSPICMDTTSITISINPIPKLSGRDTTICLRDSLDVRALLDIDPMGTLRYGLSFSVYGTSDSVVVSPEVSTTYFLIDSIESTGCFDTTMLQVQVVGPELDVLSTQTNTCPDKVVDLSMITLIDQNTVIGIAEVSYYNSESDAVDSINALTSSEVDVSGIYFIRYDIGGCYDTASVSVVIEDCPVPCDISVTLLDTICNVNGSYDLVYAMDTTNASGLQYIASISGYNIDTLSYKSNGGLDTLYGLTTGALSDTLIIEDYNPYAGIFISELHYDNTGSDVDEGVEIMAPEGTDLEGFGLLFYNGSNGASYGSVLPMTGVIGSQGGGCGAIFFDRSGIQNGPDGIALLGPTGDVVAFMSYEGSFIATNGPAKGMTSMDIGVSESGSTPIGGSLQMNDAGWQSAETATYDVINLGLSCSVIEICSDTLVFTPPFCPVLDLSISKELISNDSDGVYNLGDTVYYLIAVNNIGASVAYDIGIVDSFPDALIFLPDLSSDWEANSRLEFTIAELGIRDSISVLIAFEISSIVEDISQIWNFTELTKAATTQGGVSFFEHNITSSLNPRDSAMFSLCNVMAIPSPIIQSAYVCNDEIANIFIAPYRTDSKISLYEDFESDGNGSRYILSDDEFSDGGSDFFIRTDGPNTAIGTNDISDISGEYWFGASDLNGEGGNEIRTLTFNPTDISGLAELVLSVKLAEDDASDSDEDWDDVPSDKDYVLIDYSIDGEPYLPGIHIRPSIQGVFNSAPKVDTDFDGVGDGREVSSMFSKFSFSIPYVGERIVVRITISLDDGDEDIAIDEVMVVGDFVTYNFEISNDSGVHTKVEDVSDVSLKFDPTEYTHYIKVQSNLKGCLGPITPILVERHKGEEFMGCYGEIYLNIDEYCDLRMLNKDAFYSSVLDPAFVKITFKLKDGTLLRQKDLSNHIGRQVTFEVEDVCTSVRCWGLVNIESKNLPRSIVRVDSLLGCKPDVVTISILDIELIEDRLEQGCFAKWDNLHYEVQDESKDCIDPKLVINYFADFHIKGLKSKRLIYQHIYGILPIQAGDIISPGSYNLGSDLAWIDTIRMIACDSDGTFPEDVASYWAEILDPHDDANNGNLEGVPYSFPFLHLDSTIVIKEVLNIVSSEEVVSDTMVLVDGDWLVLDVIKKDTSYQILDVYQKYPSYMKLETGRTCNVDVKYSDQLFGGCYDGQKTLRSWTVVDWCLGGVRDMKQWIIKEDISAPEFNVINVDFEFFNNDSIFLNGVLTTADDFEVMVDVNLDLIIQVIDIIDPLVCQASLPIPVFDKLRDNCTASEDIRYSYSIDGIPAVVDVQSGVIEGFSQGASELLIEATDKCGNMANHKMTIVALDRASPSLICRDKVNVTLINDYGSLDGGQARVYLDDLNMGSSDACNDIILILGRRLDNKLFCGDSILTFIGSDYLEFCCEDVGSDIPIDLTFFDAFGNTAACETKVHINSNAEPRLLYKDDTISCYEYGDPNLVQYPEIKGVCLDARDLVYTDGFELYDNLCGEGIVQRHWSVINRDDVQHLQLLKITNDSEVFNPMSIRWPKHYNGKSNDEYLIKRIVGDTICRVGNYEEVQVLCYEYPTITCLDVDLKVPTWETPMCGLIRMNYEDNIFVGSPSCKSIIRSWSLIDWCNYIPNTEGIANKDTVDLIKDLCSDTEYYAFRNATNKNGIYTYEQELVIEDSIAPVLVCDDKTFVTNSECLHDLYSSIGVSDEGVCGDGQLLWSTTLRLNSGLLITEDYGWIGYKDSIMVISEGLDMGEYHLDVRVEDLCGNVSSCYSTITIIDRMAPMSYCVSSLATTLMSDSNGVNIWASDYIINNFDNCSEVSHYFKKDGGYVRNKSLHCSEYHNLEEGILTDTIYSIDDSGNYSYCSIQLQIIDTRNVCKIDSLLNSKSKRLRNGKLKKEQVNDFQVYQNFPNPFIDVTTISFALPRAGRVEFKLYDFSGQLILAKNEMYQNGRNYLPINSGDYHMTEGLYIYTLSYKCQTISNKMLLSN